MSQKTQETLNIKKGGMQWNGLRGATEVMNYFPGAARQNIIPNSVSEYNNISSIGKVQRNGLRGDTRGSGTLESTNIQIGGGTGIQVGSVTESQQGKIMMNEKRTQYMDYRQTDPYCVEQLRNNPLSVYAVGNVKNNNIPQFFVDTKPSDFGTRVSDENLYINEQTINKTINGSPQSNILGLSEYNPFMGR